MANRIFTPFPTLTTPRLTLRQLSTGDGQAIFALRSDPAINKYLHRQPSATIEDAINFINKITETVNKNDGIYWAITLTNSNILVGTICLFGFSDENNKCEMGYELLTDFQGQGIMKEAVEKIVDYAFGTIGVQKIEAFTHKDNQPSLKLLEHFSFKKSIEVDKENPDYIVFILTNSIDNLYKL